jgi:hypothetical protein
VLQLNPNDIKSYPLFAKHVSTQIPRLASNKQLIAAIQKFTGVTDEATISSALQWNHLPGITLKAMPPKAYGGYSPHADDGNCVINTYYVALHEDGDQDVRSTPNDKHVHIIEATLLHELVHWLKDRFGGGESEQEEAGEAFEREYYGALVTH